MTRTVLRKKHGKGSTSSARKIWSIVKVSWNRGEMNDYLIDGWEPFSATEMPDGNGYADSYVYLRKKVSK